jgi:hypothetical protein
VICSRDADYGSEFDGKVYVNDHLKQEFKDRVSQRRKLVLRTKLSDALKELDIAVTKQEEQAETEIVAQAQSVKLTDSQTTWKEILSRVPTVKIGESLSIPKMWEEIWVEGMKANPQKDK